MITFEIEIFNTIWYLLALGITIGLVLLAITAFIRMGWVLAKYLVPVLLVLYIFANWV